MHAFFFLANYKGRSEVCVLCLQVEIVLKRNKPGKIKAKKKNEEIATLNLTNKKIKIAGEIKVSKLTVFMVIAIHMLVSFGMDYFFWQFYIL